MTLGIPTRGIDGTGTVRDIVPSADPLTQTATVVVAGSPPGAQSGDPIDARIELSASHLRGMSEGVLTATATPIRIGRAIQVWHISLTNDADVLVCDAKCTVSVIDLPTR